MTAVAVLAVDLGGTTMKGAVVDETGRAVLRDVRDTPAGGQAVIDAIGDLLASLRDKAALLGTEAITGAVMSPGTIDETTGSVGFASNLGWRDVPLARLMTERIGVPVAIGHDVRAAGLADRLLGAARGLDDFVHIAIGTGVAAALVEGGTVIRGATLSPGELGHVSVLPDGESCTCGQRGCLEMVASGSAVARLWPTDHPRPVQALFEAAKDGNEKAIALKAQLAENIASAVRVLVLTIDVDTVVIGGGLSSMGTTLLRSVQSVFAHWARTSAFLASLDFESRVRVLPQDFPAAAVGAALIGAAARPA